MVRKSRNLPRRIALQKDSAVGKQTARKWGDSRALFVIYQTPQKQGGFSSR
jgi:hypothetical protein